MRRRSDRVKKRKTWIILGAVIAGLVLVAGGGWVYHEQPQFCATCHIMQPYLDSWKTTGALAQAHGAAEVDCLQCHEPTIQQQTDELVKFVRGDYETPLQEREFDDAWCLRCHEHGSVEQIAELTADLDPNPHVVSHIGQLECTTCHNSHRESEDYCGQCHGATVAATAWTTPTQVIDWFDPQMDCTVCHLMVPYVASLEDPALMAYSHAQQGAACIDCHDVETMEQIHATADATVTKVKPRPVTSDFCLGCHMPNTHSSYEQVLARTEGYIYEGESVSPHDPHGIFAETGRPEFECARCHKMHAQSRLIDFCWSCHHQENFKKCVECHGTGESETSETATTETEPIESSD
jgi:nitrate/TMAO reductase-like tetraheme cytochrome c subunit